MFAFGIKGKKRAACADRTVSGATACRKRSGLSCIFAVRYWIVWVLAGYTGCGEAPPVYEEYREVAGAGWESDTTFAFTFGIDDTTAAYRLTLILRNDRRYPYRNLWVAGAIERPAPAPADRDTTQYILADENGKWLGNGFSVFTHQFPFRENYFFPDTGIYTVRLDRLMPDPRLPGIRKIGLRIEKTRPGAASFRQPPEAPGMDSGAATGFSGK